jgi:hypothetical protein
MARAAKTIKTTKSATTGRKAERPLTVAAAAKAKATKSVLAKRSAPVVAPLEKRKPGRPAKVAVCGAPEADQGNEDGSASLSSATSAEGQQG